MELQAYLFDKFEPACLQIMQTMQQVAFLILVMGLILAIYKGRGISIEALLGPVLTAAILTAFIAAWPELVGSQGYFWKATSELAGQIESDAWTTYIEFLQDGQETWWDWVSNPRAAVTAGIVTAIGMLGQVIMYLARAFQFFFIGLVLAFGPVFLSLYAFSATRSIAVRFLSGTLAIFLWDVAWKLVDLGTLNLTRLAASSLFAATPAGLLLVAGWVILGYAFAPVVVSKALVAGESIGGALLGGATGGAGRVMATMLGVKYAATALGAGSSTGGGSVPAMPPPPPNDEKAAPPPPPASPPAAPTNPQPYNAIKENLKRSHD